MVKFFTKTVCIAFLVSLCVGNLNAQDLRGATATPCQLPLEQVVNNLPSDLATPSMDIPMLSSSRGNIARGSVSYPSTMYIEFDCSNIMGYSQIPASWHAFGGAYYQEKLYNYECESNGTGNSYFQVINSATGALISSTPRPELYASVIGSLCYDYTSDVMYAMKGGTPSTLYTVDLATGALTTVATISGVTELLLTMAIDLNGNMYAINANNTGIGNFWSINKTTGAATMVGATGLPVNYAQSMAFDYNDPACPLYWAQIAQPSSIVATWNKIDVATGVATTLATTGMEICGLHFPYDPNGPEDPKYNVYRDDVKIAGPIEETTYVDKAFTSTQAYTWSVAVVCSNGGDGEWVGLHKDACKEDIPDPCNPATNLKVVFPESGACAATLTWTAAVDMPDAEYNIYRGDTKIKTIKGTEYVDNDIEASVEYTWTVKTVCTNGEATGVNVKGLCDRPAINELTNSVAIFPNPTSGMITIDAKDFAKVEVYNTVGQLVETRTINKFDVSSYNTGVYFFKVYDTNNNSVTKRVMVTK